MDVAEDVEDTEEEEEEEEEKEKSELIEDREDRIKARKGAGEAKPHLRREPLRRSSGHWAMCDRRSSKEALGHLQGVSTPAEPAKGGDGRLKHLVNLDPASLRHWPALTRFQFEERASIGFGGTSKGPEEVHAAGMLAASYPQRHAVCSSKLCGTVEGNGTQDNCVG
jgi:hypothetical protein